MDRTDVSPTRLDCIEGRLGMISCRLDRTETRLDSLGYRLEDISELLVILTRRQDSTLERLECMSERLHFTQTQLFGVMGRLDDIWNRLPVHTVEQSTVPGRPSNLSCTANTAKSNEYSPGQDSPSTSGGSDCISVWQRKRGSVSPVTPHATSPSPTVARPRQQNTITRASSNRAPARRLRCGRPYPVTRQTESSSSSTAAWCRQRSTSSRAARDPQTRMALRERRNLESVNGHDQARDAQYNNEALAGNRRRRDATLEARRSAPRGTRRATVGRIASGDEEDEEE